MELRVIETQKLFTALTQHSNNQTRLIECDTIFNCGGSSVCFSHSFLGLHLRAVINLVAKFESLKM